jgi:hypothetical protein
MPSIRMVKMNMVVENKRPQNTTPVSAPTPVTHAFGKSKLHTSMVMRIAGTKGGCACGH